MFNHISRGARDWLRPSRFDIAQYAMCQKARLEFSHIDRGAVRRAAHFIEDCRRLPRVFMIFLPGLDGHTHRHGARAQHGYVRTVLDPLFGRLLETLRDYDPQRSDLLHHYTFVLTSDHGNAPATADKHHAVTTADVAAILREHGRHPYFFESSERLKAVDAILLNHGGSMHIAVKNGDTHHWYDPPRLKADLFALGLALNDASGTARGRLHPGWIDLILVKDIDKKRYLVLKDHKVYEAGKYFAHPQHRAAYPDAAARAAGYFAQRSADLVLLPAADLGFHFTTGSPRQAVHGGLSSHDSLCAMVFAGKRIEPGAIPAGSITGLAPTIAALFDTTLPSAQGEAFPFIAKKSAFTLFDSNGEQDGNPTDPAARPGL